MNALLSYTPLAVFSLIALSQAPFGRPMYRQAIALEQEMPILSYSLLGLAALCFLATIGRYITALHRVYSGKQMLFLLSLLLLSLVALFLILVSPIEWMHIFTYASLSILASWTFRRNTLSKPLLFAFIYSVLIGASEEILQAYVPERYFDLRDLLLNTSGAGIGIFLSRPYAQRFLEPTEASLKH